VKPTVAAVLALLLLSGCAAAPGSTPFPAGALADYQLGGAYDPPEGVTVVARDSTEEPAAGLYSICYVNGFQTQPGDDWPEELLVQVDGQPLVDPNWPDEHLIDISSPTARTGAAARLDPTLRRCADAGFDAVEFDNLDSYTRSEGRLTLDDAVAFATLLVDRAHALGLAAGQKNTAELGSRGRDEIGFDFAVVEECAVFDECGVYTSVYGDAVVDIEYTDELPRPFAEVCADPATPTTTILRDRMLTPAGDPDHEYGHC